MNEHEEIIDTDVSSELADSFLEYSMSVIVSRALPDVRDGLKPVHRRILWSMYSQGMRPERGYNKCARATGDIMGKYHPHGDAAIYDALVRLAQPWSMRLCLVDGHGNFGSLDDGPAAARYTECRLSEASMSMVQELEEETVDFKPNYDGREKEPTVLPASFPNLIINGSTGIAVGMATNMPSHNLGEVIDGIKAMIANPKISLKELMKYIPGPDFGTGGIIIGKDGIIDAYSTGKGAFKIRARTEIVDVTAKKKGIVVKELPYNVGPEKVISRIKELVNDKKLLGISDVKNYSDRKVGLRLVIEVKNGFNPKLVEEELFRLTQLEESFSVSNVALVNNQPRTLGLLDLAKHYISHRTNVVKRRTEYRLKKAQARAHILEGLIKALANIEEVVTLIKNSKDTPTARKNLMEKYDLSEIQAEAILEMTLRRLTGLEVDKLKAELKELKKLIAELAKILKDPTVLNALIIEELEKIKQAFATPRLSSLLDYAPDSNLAEANIPDTPCKVLVDYKLNILREDIESSKGEKILIWESSSNYQHNIFAITTLGRALQIPVANLTNKSTKIAEFITLIPGEKIITFINDIKGKMVIATERGAIKIINKELLSKKENNIIKLKANDLVAGADEVKHDSTSLILVTSNAQLLKLKIEEISEQGLSAAGISGMKVTENDKIIYAKTLSEEKNHRLLTMSNKASIKVSAVSDYPSKGRGTAGVRCMSFKAGENQISQAVIGENLGILTEKGIVKAAKENVKRDGTGTLIKEKPLTLGIIG